MKIGAIQVTPVSDGWLAASVRFSKPLPPKATLKPHCAMFRGDGATSCHTGALAVKTGERP